MPFCKKIVGKEGGGRIFEAGDFHETTVCTHYSIHPMNIIDLAIDVPSEEASVSYPECIM